MTNKNCLNCDTDLVGKYCSGCGQKTDTRRISFKNFLFQDVLHGTFHLDRGILYTARHALLRPGKAALDYIFGKRKRYYNVFYLILITAGLMLFLRHFYEELYVGQGRVLVENPPELNEVSKKFGEILSQKSKIIMFLFVPFAALNSFILFRRKKLNLSEHAIIGGMILLGILLLSTIANALFYVDLILPFSDALANTITFTTIGLTLIYIGYGYVNAFSDVYSKWGITWRIVLFFALIFLEIILLFYIIIGFITNWTNETITITPFG